MRHILFCTNEQNVPWISLLSLQFFVLFCLFVWWLRFRPLRLFLGLRIVVKKFAYIEVFFEIVEFFLLDIFPKPIFAQKFLRKSKLAWGCYNCKKVLQTPKVVLTLLSTNRKTCTLWLWLRLRSGTLTNPILLKTLENYDRRDLNDIFLVE